MLNRYLNRHFITPLPYKSKLNEFANKFSTTTFICKDIDGSNERKSPVRDLLDNATAFVDTKNVEGDDEWATLPYVEGTSLHRRDQSQKRTRPKMSPEDTTVILFPGQGAQYVGMGKNLIKIPSVQDMYEYASEILGYDLLKLCLEGPASKLNETRFCQPALMVTSLAALEKLKEERPNAIDNCMATAGFSLGEITALVFAGAIPFDQAVKLVQIRGEAMQMASNLHEGGMATVICRPDHKLGMALFKAKEWCVDRGVEKPDCGIANYLFPSCKVIAGSKEALHYIEQNLEKYGIRKMKKIPAYGAFHSSLMEPAVLPFIRALRATQIDDPIISVHSNIDGKNYYDAAHIRKRLPQQIVKPVKWEQTMHNLFERQKDVKFPRTFVCGPGEGLRTILKQVNSKAWDTSFTIV